MDRRNFLAKLGTGVAGGAAATAAIVRDSSREALQSDLGTRIQKDVAGIAKRVKSLEASNKRLTKALIVIASVSTGIDVYGLVNGDLLG